MDLANLILQCALAVHPETATAIVQQESGGNPYALNTQRGSLYPQTREEASRLLHAAMERGGSTDLV